MKRPRSVTVDEMIEKLENFKAANGDDAGSVPVFGSCSYGDRSRTEQLVPLDEPEMFYPSETAYSDSGWSKGESTEEVEWEGDELDMEKVVCVI